MKYGNQKSLQNTALITVGERKGTIKRRARLDCRSPGKEKKDVIIKINMKEKRVATRRGRISAEIHHLGDKEIAKSRNSRFAIQGLKLNFFKAQIVTKSS